MTGSGRLRILAGAAALAMAGLVALGARQVELEGRAVEAALRAGHRDRLEAEAARLRRAVEAAEAAPLEGLPGGDLDAVRAALAASPPPVGHWFVVGRDGELLYPERPGALRPAEDPERVAAAGALLARGRDAARRGETPEALAAYRAFLDAFPSPPLEPQSRPLAWLQIARLEAGRGAVAAAGEALLGLEAELAGPDLAPRAGLVAFYRERSDALARELGDGLPDPERRRGHRALGDARAARARFLEDLRSWLAGRVRLEMALRPDAGAAPVHFAERVRDRTRRVAFRVLAAPRPGVGPIAVGFESDPERLAEVAARLAGAAEPADGVAVRVVPAGEDAPGPTVALGPDLPGLRLALDLPAPDPAARAAGTRRLLLGGLVGGALLLVGLALVLVLRHAATRGPAASRASRPPTPGAGSRSSSAAGSARPRRSARRSAGAPSSRAAPRAGTRTSSTPRAGTRTSSTRSSAGSGPSRPRRRSPPRC